MNKTMLRIQFGHNFISECYGYAEKIYSKIFHVIFYVHLLPDRRTQGLLSNTTVKPITPWYNVHANRHLFFSVLAFQCKLLVLVLPLEIVLGWSLFKVTKKVIECKNVSIPNHY